MNYKIRDKENVFLNNQAHTLFRVYTGENVYMGQYSVHGHNKSDTSCLRSYLNHIKQHK